MDIRPEASGIDPLARQRQLERLQQERRDEAQERAPASGAREGDAQVDVRSAATERFVRILSEMDPSDLHKVEDLRERIADGSYTARPEELVDPLLEALIGNDDD